MRIRCILAALSLGALTLSVWALGPVDGTDLAPTDLTRVRVGAQAPDFALQDSDGTVVSLSEYQGEKAVVLVFYRGHW